MHKILVIDTFNTNKPREKLFIHYDRACYSSGETLWAKGYISSAKDYMALDSSKIVYIEIFNSSGVLMRRTCTYCAAGTFYSNIKLNEADFNPGDYKLRAYTNHMRNYGDSLFFESWFKVINSKSNDWNLSIQKLALTKRHFELNAGIVPFASKSRSPKNVSIILFAKNKIVFKKEISVKENGHFSADTLFDADIQDEIVEMEISNKNDLKLRRSVLVTGNQKIDLQFLPEGGSFIANKRQKLGFKAVGIMGTGVPVNGRIENSKRQVVATFSSVHKGMGIVWVTPEENEKYIAILDNGLQFSLPVVENSGTQLQVTNDLQSDSVFIFLDASPSLYNKDFFLRAHVNGITCAMGTIHLKDKPYTLALTKKIFPSGVCRVTIYDQAFEPVNERAVFIDHHDTLHLQLFTDKVSYYQRDSVHILFKAEKSDFKPVVGSFSIAVIDTGQVHYSKYSDNIISYMRLKSELRGDVEDPYYYLQAPAPEAIDALMLTQGWVHYERFPQKQIFDYENEFTIKGMVANVINKPIANSEVTLFGKNGKHNSFVLQTKTNAIGQFIFSEFPTFITDSVSTLIKSGNKKGSSFGITVTIDASKFPAYSNRNPPALPGDFLHDSDASYYSISRDRIAAKIKSQKGVLPEVIVSSRIKIKGSQNLNDDGASDLIIPSRILEKTPKATLLDILTNNIPGFHKGPLGSNPLLVYKRNGDYIIFVIDGYNINKAYDPTSESLLAFTEYEDIYLKYITAEDIEGIEVMSTGKNTDAYERYYGLYSGLITYTFIEITTHSGNGAFDKKLPGIYLYKPVVPVIAKIFYSPRYSSSENDSPETDYRTTVFWKPDVITNEAGEAEFSFFTSNSQSSYLGIVQGTDMKGNFGVFFFPIPIIHKENKELQ